MRARSDLLSGKARPRRPARGESAGKREAGPARLPPAERRALLLSRASEFFAEYGLTAQTRALADACGVAQRLLYRYFPSKAALLDEVYKEAIVAPFRAVWLVQLRDRSVPIEERLVEFYLNYFDVVLTRRWLRLFLYASLAEARMAPDYNSAIIYELLETIVRETAHEMEVALPAKPAVLHEIGWMLHGAVSHFAIRRHLYGASRTVVPRQVLAMQVRGFLAGFRELVAHCGSPAPAPSRRPTNGRSPHGAQL